MSQQIDAGAIDAGDVDVVGAAQMQLTDGFAVHLVACYHNAARHHRRFVVFPLKIGRFAQQLLQLSGIYIVCYHQQQVAGVQYRVGVRYGNGGTVEQAGGHKLMTIHLFDGQQCLTIDGLIADAEGENVGFFLTLPARLQFCFFGLGVDAAQKTQQHHGDNDA